MRSEKIKKSFIEEKILPYFDHGIGEKHITYYNTIKECSNDLNELNIIENLFGFNPWDYNGHQSGLGPVVSIIGKGYRFYIIRYGRVLKIMLRRGLSDGFWIGATTARNEDDIIIFLEMNGLKNDK